MTKLEIYGYQEYAKGLMNLASSMSAWMGPSFCDAYCYLPEEFEAEFIRDMRMKKMPAYEECPDSDRDTFVELFGKEEKQLLDGLQYWLNFELGPFEKAYRIVDEEKLLNRMDGNRNNTRFFFLETIRILKYRKVILVLVCGNNE
ncbi:MAG: hypothetical protein IJH14_09500 [Solobacterium sp.]|nr:hypothetical protein [Solobacterium sp.]